MRLKPLLLGAAASLAASAVMATSFVVPTDEELIAKSQVIVTGTVEGSYVQESGMSIETVYEIRVERSIKGLIVKPDELVRVVSYGGVVGDRGLLVEGEAHFRAGERVLLFLTRHNGRWRTTDMTLGKFRFVTSTAGERLLVREMEDVVGWDHAGRVHEEKVRREAGFLRFIEGHVRGARESADYAVEASQVTLPPEESDEPVMIENAPFPGWTYSSWLGSSPIRWPNAASGITFRKSPQNISGVSDGGASTIQNGLAAWTNECGSAVNLIYGGGTSTQSANFDSVNVVEFGDPQGRIGGTWTGSGTVALTFLSFTGNPHQFEGRSWENITDADVVFQDGYPGTAASFPAAMTHELGHGIGFRHSNQDYETPGAACVPSKEECTSAAIMNSSVSGNFGFTLQPWDINAVQSIYPGGTCGPACTGPTITGQPQSTTITSGGSATLTVTAAGTSPLSYQWYIGATGNTSQPIAGATSNSIAVRPTVTTSYWVRVTNECGAINSVTATVTVQSSTPCTGPTITGQPQSRTITSGGSATLTVTAAGTSPLSYQW
ncbi:MAG TPA: hypothetical protein VHL59_16400, partial [Thermoanaerobaculia bacterium]|nr:hypothetical protein [Thermoanaerobaculia bacterium]